MSVSYTHLDVDKRQVQLLRNIPEVLPQPCVATIGFFDGVHRGHRYLIEQVREVAAAHGFASGVVTFPVHPRKVVQPERCV